MQLVPQFRAVNFVLDSIWCVPSRVGRGLRRKFVRSFSLSWSGPGLGHTEAIISKTSIGYEIQEDTAAIE